MTMRSTSLGLAALLALLLLGAPQPTLAQAGRSTGLPLPRFVSLNDDRVNVRFGPGKQYPINWVFGRQDLPVEIVQEFDTWRKIRDYEGAEGWIHSSLLSSRRMIMIIDGISEVRRTPSLDSRVVLRAEERVLGRLFDCEEDWCRVEIEGRRGWLQRSDFWGTTPGEILRQRHVYDILPETEPAHSLLVVEVVTPGGSWSSYPSHKHDSDDLPRESKLEETYYHRVHPAQGFAFQRVYTADGSLDETMCVHDGDLVMVPRGYHPVGAAHGYDLYYLNVMAGPRRVWKFTTEACHQWLLS